MDLRRKTALKNMRYNRFIFLRYSLALFFFTNLNWLILMLPSINIAILVPLSMIISAIFPIQEFLKAYNSNKHQIMLKNTKIFFSLQLLINFLLMGSTINSRVFSTVYPFLNFNSYGITGILGVLILGSIVSAFCLRKINALRFNKDSGYKTYVNFKNSLKVSETHGK
ncbi:hypothetical protein ACEN4P_08905 [Marinilactibacillus psychrotolerans]|uniref:PTS cellobiose transporter subunit IIC n=2 Tax=Marinilactibacillus TaxID=191769 RepID=A0ABW8UL11_9LACT|nr:MULTISPECIES: hypothetical protein [Marinilactibacillus]API89794.1 hypothetical protein BKP56_11215 [Marinilactibacillus sp. 15R]SFK10488.1 hypothetical protein SAMN04488569_10109 [Marinilactibacillus piezotolerans]